MSLCISTFLESLLGIDSWGHLSTRLQRSQKGNDLVLAGREVRREVTLCWLSLGHPVVSRELPFYAITQPRAEGSMQCGWG